MEIVDDFEIRNDKRGKYERGLSTRDRFFQYVDKKGKDECCEWNGPRNEDGYGLFYCNGKSRKAHRVAYMLEYGEIPEGKEITHICNNPACVNHKHLKVDTHQGNIDYMIECGRARHPKGEEHPNHIFTWEIIKNIRREYSENDITQEELAAKYETSRRSIYLILNNIIWTDEKYKPVHKGRSKGEHNSHAKLTWEQVKEIKQQCKQRKLTYLQIAEKYNVSRTAIDYISRNKSWFDAEYQKYIDNKHKSKYRSD